MRCRHNFPWSFPHDLSTAVRPARDHGSSHDQGVALVITLLLLFLMSVMGLAAVLTSSSDLLINGYYRNFRGSFYAADSGMAIARQALINQTTAAIPGTFTAGTAPIPAGTEGTVQTYITTNYGASTTLNAGTAASSWKEGFKITNVTYGLLASPAQPTVTSTDATTHLPTGYQYIYNYTLTSVGTSQGSEHATASESGSITFNAAISPGAPSKTSFAAFGMFIDQQGICTGSTLVPGIISGPVFTNGSWTFGTSGAYTFTDTVGSAGAKAGFQFGSCYQSTNGNYTSGGQNISPTYQAGRQWGQNTVPLPTNDFSQKLAVVNGVGDPDSCSGSPCPNNTQMHAALKNISGTTYPSSGASSGVYLSYSNISGTNTVTGGGILVEGNASVTLSTSGTSAQVFTITQGSTITTVTVNPVTNTTVVQSGSTNLTLAGVPTNCSMISPAPSTCTSAVAGSTPATMLYVDGTISSLSGPSSGPAIQNASQVTVTSFGDMSITGNLKYPASPVTQTSTPSVPIDTLIPANDTHEVLGLFTATGDINLHFPTSNQNWEIDASLATISQGGSGGMVNDGNAINTLTIVGGRIQSTIQNINSTTRNVLFDRRFATGFAPPWFPATTITPAGVSSATVTPTFSRVQWVSVSSE